MQRAMLVACISFALPQTFFCMEPVYENQAGPLSPEKIEELLRDAQKLYGLGAHKLVFSDTPHLGHQYNNTITLTKKFIEKDPDDQIVSSSFYGEDNAVYALFHELAHEMDGSSVKRRIALSIYPLSIGASYLLYDTFLDCISCWKRRSLFVVAGLMGALVIHSSGETLVERYLESRANQIDCKYLYNTGKLKPLCNRLAYLQAAITLQRSHDECHPTPLQEFKARQAYLAACGLTVESTVDWNSGPSIQALKGLIILKKMMTDAVEYRYPWHLAWKNK